MAYLFKSLHWETKLSHENILCIVLGAYKFILWSLMQLAELWCLNHLIVEGLSLYTRCIKLPSFNCKAVYFPCAASCFQSFFIVLCFLVCALHLVLKTVPPSWNVLTSTNSWVKIFRQNSAHGTTIGYF